LNYISTLPQFSAYSPVNAPANVTDWAQGSSIATTDGFASVSFRRDTWFQLAGDTYMYPIQGPDGHTGAIISEMNRIEATLAATSKAITYNTPTYYTLLLLDQEFSEAAYTFTATALNVRFISLSGSTWKCGSGTCALKQGTLRYGNFIFEQGVTLHNTGAPFMTNNDLVTWNTANCIRFDMRPGSRLATIKSDLISASVKLGSFKLLGVHIDQRPTTGGAHVINVNCQGDFIVLNTVVELAPVNTDGIVYPDSRIFEQCSGRKIVVDGYKMVVKDPDGLLSAIRVFSPPQAIGTPIHLSNISITLPDASTTNVSLVVSALTSFTGAPDIYMSDCYIKAPGNTGTLKLYSAVAGDNCKIHASHCAGGTIDTPSAGTKTVDNTFAT
jgi:hypothetical protein